MKFLKRNANSVILCLFEILVGVLLLINASKFTTVIVTIFGAVLIVTGVISVISYFRTEAIEAAAGKILFKGLLALAAGVFCVTQAKWFIGVLPFVAIIYGVAVLVAGLVKIQWTVDLLRMKLGRWALPAISAVVSIVCGIVILRNPFSAAVVLWIFTGVSLIVEAVLDLVALIMVSAASRSLQE